MVLKYVLNIFSFLQSWIQIHCHYACVMFWGFFCHELKLSGIIYILMTKVFVTNTYAHPCPPPPPQIAQARGVVYDAGTVLPLCINWPQ